MYVCLWLITRDWITYQGLVPRGEKVTLFQRPLLACRSSSSGESFWNFSRHVLMSGGIVICRLYLDTIYILLIFHGTNFPVIARKSCGTCLGPLTLIIFQFPLLPCFLGLRCRGCIVVLLSGIRSPLSKWITQYLNFDQLWVSVIVTICAKTTSGLHNGSELM